MWKLETLYCLAKSSEIFAALGARHSGEAFLSAQGLTIRFHVGFISKINGHTLSFKNYPAGLKLGRQRS